MSTQQKIQKWMLARARVESSRARLKADEAEMREQGQAIGAAIAPGDLLPTEKICVWVRVDQHQEQLFWIVKADDGTYRVGLRGDPRPEEKGRS